MVEVPTQTTGSPLVLLAHLQVDPRASIPGQREAKHTLHQKIICQSLNKNTAHSVRETQPEIKETDVAEKVNFVKIIMVMVWNTIYIFLWFQQEVFIENLKIYLNFSYSRNETHAHTRTCGLPGGPDIQRCGSPPHLGRTDWELWGMNTHFRHTLCCCGPEDM